MSSWYDGVLEIDNICEYQYDSHDTFMIRVKDQEKFLTYNNYFVEYVVFRYVYLNCSSNEYNKDGYKVFKNSFITGIIRENDGKYVINFHFGEMIRDKKELRMVLRGIKLNKLKNKIKST